MKTSKLTANDIDLLFTYHNPKDLDPARFDAIRTMAKTLGNSILSYGGKKEDVERSLLKLRECVFYAIASIVVPELSEE